MMSTAKWTDKGSVGFPSSYLAALRCARSSMHSIWLINLQCSGRKILNSSCPTCKATRARELVKNRTTIIVSCPRPPWSCVAQHYLTLCLVLYQSILKLIKMLQSWVLLGSSVSQWPGPGSSVVGTRKLLSWLYIVISCLRLGKAEATFSMRSQPRHVMSNRT